MEHDVKENSEANGGAGCQGNPGRADIIKVEEPICCEHCGRKLVNRDASGIYVSLIAGGCEQAESGRIDKIVFCCKGKCDTVVKSKYCELEYYDSGWEDISDLLIPTTWLARFMAFVNHTRQHDSMSDEAFEQFKRMFIESFPYVARQLTAEEQQKVFDYLRFDAI